MDTIRAWRYGLRSTLPWSIRGRSCRPRSGRRRAASRRVDPAHAAAHLGPRRTVAPAGPRRSRAASATGRGALPGHGEPARSAAAARMRPVAGAAAQVAGQAVPDRPPRRSSRRRQQGVDGERHGRRAEAALDGGVAPERVGDAPRTPASSRRPSMVRHARARPSPRRGRCRRSPARRRRARCRCRTPGRRRTAWRRSAPSRSRSTSSSSSWGSTSSAVRRAVEVTGRRASVGPSPRPARSPGRRAAPTPPSSRRGSDSWYFWGRSTSADSQRDGPGRAERRGDGPGTGWRAPGSPRSAPPSGRPRPRRPRRGCAAAPPAAAPAPPPRASPWLALGDQRRALVVDAQAVGEQDRVVGQELRGVPSVAPSAVPYSGWPWMTEFDVRPGAVHLGVHHRLEVVVAAMRTHPGRRGRAR